MAVTIKDVAKKAGVSISTVSRVINNSKPVSLEVRKKVLEAINDLGYKPNEVARSLVTRRSKLIGVIVTDIGNSYIAEMVRGIEEVGRMYSYDIILSSSYGNKDTEKRFAQLLLSKQVEGIILISEEKDNEVIEEMIDKKVPFIYLNRYYLSDRITSVSIDYKLASYDMTKYVLELGHKNIVYITYDNNEEYSIEKYKLDGYNKAIKEEDGVGFVLRSDGYKIQDGYKIGQNVLDFIKEKSVSAVFCCHDELAIGLMSYFYDNNIRIPKDISICGFGDLKIASIYRPRLTTIREPYYDIGAVAIRRIIKVINNEKVDNENIYLPTQIMKRESCEKVK